MARSTCQPRLHTPEGSGVSEMKLSIEASFVLI